MRYLKNIAIMLMVIGALNWGLVGLFQFDLVAALFGSQQMIISRWIYALIGFGGLYYITSIFHPIDDSILDLDTEQEVRVSDGLRYGAEFGEDVDLPNPHAHSMQTKETYRDPRGDDD